MARTKKVETTEELNEEVVTELNPNAAVAIVSYKQGSESMRAEYTREVHGQDFIAIAKEVAEKVGGTIETE